jgi:hypothetical protein
MVLWVFGLVESRTPRRPFTHGQVERESDHAITFNCINCVSYYFITGVRSLCYFPCGPII